VILTDAGPLVALIDQRQPQHERCSAILNVINLPMLTTWPAFTEAMYLLRRIGGWPLQNNIWNQVACGTLVFHGFTALDHERMQALMDQYRDRPMDLADASLVVAVEATGESKIFTIDSDFYIYQRHGSEPFEVVP
jgi:predicted nucleic acid-binding protein